MWVGGWKVIIVSAIECEGWRQHSSLIFLILQFTKPNIEVSGWLYQTKTHFIHIVYQPFSRVLPPSFTLYAFSKLSTAEGTSQPSSSCHINEKIEIKFTLR